MKCADLLVDRLYHIYSAIYNKRMYYAPWKAFNTIVLHKPGKPNYEVPKAYRLIMLINTLWKVLTAILAKQANLLCRKIPTSAKSPLRRMPRVHHHRCHASAHAQDQERMA